MVALQRGPIYAVETTSDLINLSLLRKQQRSTNPGGAVQYFTQHWSLIPSVPSLQSEIFVFKPVHLPDLSLWEDSCCFLPVSATCSHGLTSLTYLQIHKQTWKRNRWSQRIWAVTLGNQNEPLLSDSLDMSRDEDWHCQNCAGWGQPSVHSGPALRHPEAPGCSLHSTLGQGSTWHDSKQSREPEALPGQTAMWHLLPGTKEMSNSIQQPSGRALTSALCVRKISGGERDLTLCSRNARFSGLHTSYRCLKYCTKTRGKKNIRTWDKNLLICTFWTPSAANSMVLCYTQHEVRCSHCVWTRQSAATVILNISLNNFKQVQTSSVRNFTCGPSHLVSQLSSGNSYATSFCMPQSCQTPWHWEQDTDCLAVAYSCLQHFTQEPECSASSNHDTSWCTIPTFKTNLKNQNSA